MAASSLGRWLLVAMGVLAVGIAAFFVVKSRNPGGSDQNVEHKLAAKKDEEPVAVTVAAVTPRAIQRKVISVGTLYGFTELTVTPKIEGVVTKILYDIGDIVEPGAALLEIEGTYYSLAVKEAERALELELAKLSLKDLPAGEVNYEVLPNVVKAKSEEASAFLRVKRATDLFSSKAMSREEVEKSQRDHEVAVASRDQTIVEARTTLASARLKHALLATAKQKLEETKVRAPDPSKERIDSLKASLGHLIPTKDTPAPRYVVAQRLVAEGEMVRAFPSVPVFRLVVDQPLKLITTIPERHVGEVKAGQKAELQVEAYPKEVFTGTVMRVNPVVDRASRTFVVEILLPNADRKLRPGGFAAVAIATHVDDSAPTVPEEALVRFAGVTKVFAVRNDKAQSIEVQPGVRLEIPGKSRTENWFEISGSLDLGERVVTTGHSKLVEGSPVRIR